ncbi:MAG: Ig-like domain repeat protein [Propionibacteriaceae bacterium]|nr:Ig-like domain repeat protein [Propionibacteriaceae bacterium]
MKRAGLLATVTGAVVGLLTTMAPVATTAFAATEPTFPSTSDAPIYLVDGNDNIQYAAGTELPWNPPLNAHISAVPALDYLGSDEPYRLPYVAGAEQFITFISDPGHERARADWKAYGVLWSLNGKGALLPNVNPTYQYNGLPGQAALKTTGGTYSLGVAYVKDTGQTVVAAYFTAINVDPTVGTWKFATPVPATDVATTTALTANPTSLTAGGSTTLTATVSATGKTVAGDVEFFEGSTSLGSATLANGAATKSVPVATAAVHTYTVKFLGKTVGSDKFLASTSAAVTVTATAPASKQSTTTSLSASPTSVATGAKTTLTATVTPSAATGNVQFFEGTKLLGSGSVSGGKASLAVTVGSAGSHSYTAKFVANDTHNESTSAVAKVTAISKKFTKAVKPTISGTAKVGKKLTAKVKAWSPKATFKYQWFAGGKAIKAATKSTYKLTKSQKGKKITVKVTGSATGYVSVSLTSKATAKVT